MFTRDRKRENGDLYIQSLLQLLHWHQPHQILLLLPLWPMQLLQCLPHWIHKWNLVRNNLLTLKFKSTITTARKRVLVRCSNENSCQKPSNVSAEHFKDTSFILFFRQFTHLKQNNIQWQKGKFEYNLKKHSLSIHKSHTWVLSYFNFLHWNGSYSLEFKLLLTFNRKYQLKHYCSKKLYGAWISQLNLTEKANE